VPLSYSHTLAALLCYRHSHLVIAIAKGLFSLVEQIDSHLPSLLLQTESAIQSSNFQTKPFSILSCIALRAITLDGLYSFYSFTLSYVPRSTTVARKERERERKRDSMCQKIATTYACSHTEDSKPWKVQCDAIYRDEVVTCTTKTIVWRCGFICPTCTKAAARKRKTTSALDEAVRYPKKKRRRCDDC
jgi:hypothetical protein